MIFQRHCRNFRCWRTEFSSKNKNTIIYFNKILVRKKELYLFSDPFFKKKMWFEKINTPYFLASYIWFNTNRFFFKLLLLINLRNQNFIGIKSRIFNLFSNYTVNFACSAQLSSCHTMSLTHSIIWCPWFPVELPTMVAFHGHQSLAHSNCNVLLTVRNNIGLIPATINEFYLHDKKIPQKILNHKI